MRLNHLFAPLFALFTLAPAFAAPGSADPSSTPIPRSGMSKGPEGEVYLFGSIHLLPKNIAWRTRQVDAAIERADVFVFEVSTDDKAQATIRQSDRHRGHAAAGPIAARDAAAILAADVRRRHGQGASLASTRSITKSPGWCRCNCWWPKALAKHYSPDAGVDHAVMAIAARSAQAVALFRDHRAAIRLLAGGTDKLQLSEFESDLKDFGKSDDDLAPDGGGLEQRPGGQAGRADECDLADHPEMKKALADRPQPALGRRRSRRC